MNERAPFKQIENYPGPNEPLFSDEEIASLQEYAARRRKQAKYDVGARAVGVVMVGKPPSIYRPPRIVRPTETAPPRIVRLAELPADEKPQAEPETPTEVIPAPATPVEDYKPRHAKPETDIETETAPQQPKEETLQETPKMPESKAETPNENETETTDTRELAPGNLRESFASVGQIARQFEQFNTGPFSKLDATAMRTLGAKLDIIRAALYADSKGDASKFSRAKQALNFAPNTPVSEIQARLRSVARDLEKQYKF